jgi:hypothetical protein
MNAFDPGAWSANWARSLPLIVLNVVIHVIGLGLINESVVRSRAAPTIRLTACWLNRSSDGIVIRGCSTRDGLEQDRLRHLTATRLLRNCRILAQLR